MAEEFTILPDFAKDELNTKIIEQDNLPLMMLQANVQRWQMNKDAQLQHEKELNEQLSNMDYDSSGVWDVDLPEINKDIKGYIEWIKQNPSALTKTVDNLEMYQQMMQKRNDILYKIGKSKADKIIYEKQQQFIDNPKNIDYRTPNNSMILNKFYTKDDTTSLLDRKWNGYVPPDIWDERSVIDFGRNKFMKTRSLNATTDYTPDSEVMGYIGTIMNTPKLANQFMHHYQSQYDMMLNNNPNQEVEIYDKESIKKSKNGNLQGNGTLKKISEITPLQLGISSLINGLYYKKEDIKQYAGGSNNSGGQQNKKYIVYEPGITVTVSTLKPEGKSKGDRMDLIAVGGWNVAGTSEAPRNINIQPPIAAVDEYGKVYDKKTIGTGTWNIDIVGIYDIKTDKSEDNFVSADNKDAVTTKRYVKVIKRENDGTNKTYMIPYTSHIENAIRSTGLILGEPHSTQNTTSSPQQSQPSSQQRKYVFKDGRLILQ